MNKTDATAAGVTPENTNNPAETCAAPDLEGAHAATIRTMMSESPPFRPEATPEELVAEFANGENRMPAFRDQKSHVRASRFVGRLSPCWLITERPTRGFFPPSSA